LFEVREQRSQKKNGQKLALTPSKNSKSLFMAR